MLWCYVKFGFLLKSLIFKFQYVEITNKFYTLYMLQARKILCGFFWCVFKALARPDNKLLVSEPLILGHVKIHKKRKIDVKSDNCLFF